MGWRENQVKNKNSRSNIENKIYNRVLRLLLEIPFY